MQHKPNIILCGFMGSGKTTVGCLLAKAMNKPFIDMDAWIEKEVGLTVAQIFAQDGEEAFRQHEHKAACVLGKQEGIVLATGGGALTFSRNVPPLREKGQIVFLNPGFTVCYTRIHQSDRPLVQTNSYEQLQILYEERAKMYRAVADIEFESDALPETCATQLLALLEQRNRQ